MGCNYYWRLNPEDEPLHIGKSSGGWCFMLHVIPEKGINSLDDWGKLLLQHDSQVTDEYGRTVTIGDLLKIITERSWFNGEFPENPPAGNETWGHFHDANYSQFGPRGLLRFRISHIARCVGHAPDNGTYDLITGDFS